MPAKHLLFLSTVFPTPWEPHKGPANVALVGALRELGVQVSVIAPVPWTARWRNARHPEVHGASYPTYWYAPGFRRDRYDRALWSSVQGALRGVSTTNGRVDAVLAFWTHPDGAVAVRYGNEHGIPSGVIAAGTDIMRLPDDPARRAVISATLQGASHIFGVGNTLVRRTIGLGADPSKVSNFVQGVDLTRFAPGDRVTARRELGLPESGPLLIWIGNMVAIKAAERVIVAARALSARWPDLQVVMIGGGPMSAHLKALAAQSGALAAQIHFPGPMPAAQLPSWYRAANAVLLPSRSEGMPNVLLEAMAVGCPFVASDVGSIADLLPFGNSAVTKEGDIEAFTTAIAALIDGLSMPPKPKGLDLFDGAREIIRHLHLDGS